MSSTHSSRRNSDLVLKSTVGELVAERSGHRWCLFINRDGVINRRIVDDYVRSWEDFEWLPGAKTALKVLRAWAPYLVVVTNQQGVGKQLMDADDVATIHDHVRGELAGLGVTIDAFQVCPHLAASGCSCRKPKPGLVLDWLDQHPDSDPLLAAMVGDTLSDLELANNVAAVTGGCAGIEIGGSAGGSACVSADMSFETLRDFAVAVDRERREQGS